MEKFLQALARLLPTGYVTDAGTGFRRHEDNQAVPTAVTEKDMNQLIWSLMEIVKAAGLSGLQFDETNPATYQRLLLAFRSAGVFQTAAALDNTTKPATTAFVRNELLSLGNAAYGSMFGASVVSPGYQKLPSGLIVQWGTTGALTAGTSQTVTLPVTYPTANLLCLATPWLVASQPSSSAGGNSNSLSTVQIWNTSSIASSFAIHWLSLGK